MNDQGEVLASVPTASPHFTTRDAGRWPGACRSLGSATEAQTRFEPGLIGPGRDFQSRRALKARWIGEPLQTQDITSTEEVRCCVNLLISAAEMNAAKSTALSALLAPHLTSLACSPGLKSGLRFAPRQRNRFQFRQTSTLALFNSPVTNHSRPIYGCSANRLTSRLMMKRNSGSRRWTSSAKECWVARLATIW